MRLYCGGTATYGESYDSIAHFKTGAERFVVKRIRLAGNANGKATQILQGIWPGALKV